MMNRPDYVKINKLGFSREEQLDDLYSSVNRLSQMIKSSPGGANQINDILEYYTKLYYQTNHGQVLFGSFANSSNIYEPDQTPRQKDLDVFIQPTSSGLLIELSDIYWNSNNYRLFDNDKYQFEKFKFKEFNFLDDEYLFNSFYISRNKEYSNKLVDVIEFYQSPDDIEPTQVIIDQHL